MKINELHDRLFELLCTIDDICKKENVRYFLDSGTAIGAVREKDFIPWDDDMDIKLLARDYPAFKAAMEKHLPEHLHLIEPDAFAPNFYDFCFRIYDDRYFIRKEKPEDAFYGNLQNHVGTDVFIYSDAPSSKIAQKWLELKTKILYGMGMAHRYTIKDEKYTFVQKAEVALLRVLGRFVSAKRICAWWKKMAMKRRGNGSDRDMLFPCNYLISYLRFFPAVDYRDTVEGEIRGRKFPLPIGIDNELTAIYGDYMQPPKDRDIYIKHLDEEDAY